MAQKALFLHHVQRDFRAQNFVVSVKILPALENCSESMAFPVFNLPQRKWTAAVFLKAVVNKKTQKKKNPYSQFRSCLLPTLMLMTFRTLFRIRTCYIEDFKRRRTMRDGGRMKRGTEREMWSEEKAQVSTALVPSFKLKFSKAFCGFNS